MGLFTPTKNIYVDIRSANPAEIPLIQLLHTAALDSDAHTWWLRSIRDHLTFGRYQVLVAERGRGLMGYAMYAVDGLACELKLIAVRPDWRRRGIATKLTQWLIGRAETFRMAVPEECLVGQQFARSLNLAATPTHGVYAIWDDFWSGSVYRFSPEAAEELNAIGVANCPGRGEAVP